MSTLYKPLDESRGSRFSKSVQITYPYGGSPKSFCWKSDEASYGICQGQVKHKVVDIGSGSEMRKKWFLFKIFFFSKIFSFQNFFYNLVKTRSKGLKEVVVSGLAN